jgi:hypothetical protein
LLLLLLSFCCRLLLLSKLPFILLLETVVDVAAVDVGIGSLDAKLCLEPTEERDRVTG